MGNLLPAFLRKASKPLREFNIESRVEKVIAQDKPTPAPRHPGTEVKLTPVQEDEVKKNIFEIDEHLLKRLEQVYVTSRDPVKEKEDKEKTSSRSMPVDRSTFEGFPFGYKEPKVVPYGKMSLKTAVEIISKSKESPENWVTKMVAEEYKLDVSKTENLLEYFSTFTLVVPEASPKKKGLYMPQFLLSGGGAHKVIEIPLGKNEKEMEKEKAELVP